MNPRITGKLLDVSEKYTASSFASVVNSREMEFILPKPTEYFILRGKQIPETNTQNSACIFMKP
jgi:hypothetical protein